MNRAFKTEFHNGGEKTIATISFSVNNGKLFNELDEQRPVKSNERTAKRTTRN